MCRRRPRPGIANVVALLPSQFAGVLLADVSDATRMTFMTFAYLP